MARIRESCADHPRAMAGWRCRGGARALCPECVALDVLENGARIISCSACDGRAEPLLEPGGEGTVRQHLWRVMQVPVSWFTMLLAPIAVWALWWTRRLEPAATTAVL